MPVQLNSDDIYHILRKRIFTNVGTVSQIQEVQKEFQMNATLLSKTSASPFIVSEATEYSKQLITSYPFHPAFKGLLGRFQANTGFQQTRGVLRMMHAIAFNIFNNPNVDPWLIAPECMDLNDTNILSSITGANQYLISAISEDIASNGNGVAECGARSEIGPISPCS
jgi:predicted AAA+ superfamily ATPase